MTKNAYSKTLFSPAKINLFLHITGRRVDGYHNLQTVFRLLDWGDTLQFVPRDITFLPNELLAGLPDVSPIRIFGDNLPTVRVTDNLIYQASMALLKYTQTLAKPFVSSTRCRTQQNFAALPVIDIHLQKKIPAGAGLGGGSSNAASTLLALNDIWQLGLSIRQLKNIGADLGADVPIFVAGHDAIAEGIGEVLYPIQLPPQHFLLLLPTEHMATATFFKEPSLQRNCPTLAVDAICQQQTEFMFALNPPYTNVFEPLVIAKSAKVAQAFAYLAGLQSLTGSTPRLTGTGACVFLPFANTQLEAVRQYLHSHPSPCPTVLTQSSSKTPTPHTLP